MQNREIKFRAWDGIRMTTSGIMFNTTTGCLVVPTEQSFTDSPINNNWVLMQFTGLHDKNGKEIYENDVVRLWLNDGFGNKDEYTGKIIFADGQFMIDSLKDVVYNEPKCQYLPHNCMLLSQPELYEVITKQYISNYGEVYTFSENAMYVEVIGNLYENPDLIK